MNLRVKFKNVLRRLKQSWGTARVKRNLWNKEFAEGRWDFIEKTAGDIIYPIIERHSENGAILDLGCGSGNTGCELNAEKYSVYTGVDISDVAVGKAIKRSVENRRENKNHYFQSDITTYAPSQKYNVILFRESIYYIPRPKIKPLLERYSHFLKEEGVFIIRWHDQRLGGPFVILLRDDYIIKEQIGPDPAGPFVVVFTPKR